MLNTMSMKTVRNLINKSLKPQQDTHNPPKGTQTHPSFADENAPPVNPNIPQQQLPFSNTKMVISPKKPSGFSSASSQMKSLEGSRSEGDPAVKVVVRVRPKTVNEKMGDPTIRKVSEDSVVVGDRKFVFDSVLDQRSKQEDVFQLVGAPLVKDALAGYNASVLSYGQTGSGKTYTMWGPPSAMVEGQSPRDQQGIVPRIFQMLFSEIEREKANADSKLVNYQCRCSFLEIRNGQIGDLLDPTQRNLQIKDDAKNGFYIENLTEEYVTCYDDVTQILIKGLSSRKVGATNMNSKSSRSHIVFTCVIESWCKAQETPSSTFISSKTSRISLVDLAGLDRNKQAELGREFERERKDLKSSLLHLGHLVNILAKGTQPDDLMYRDSCLTHLLQQSLGGNAKLSVICNISPDLKNFSETVSTLRLGSRVKSIQNKPVINEITEEDMDGLTDQIRQLKEELLKAKLNASPVGSGNGQLGGRSVRESVNQLRISLNRSLLLPTIDNEVDDDIHADENDITELCKQLDMLHRSCEEIPRDMSCDSESMNFASVRGSCDSYFTSEHDVNCLHDSLEVSSAQALKSADPAARSSISIASSRHSSAFEEPAPSESPKIKNNQRKSIVNSPSLLGGQSALLESSNICSDVARKSVSQSEPLRSSLRSSKIFSGPTESLAASLKRGLEIIENHQHNSSLNKSTVTFSFEHVMLKPSPAADKVNASVQTLSEGKSSLEGSSSFVCATCRQKEQAVTNGVDDSLKTWMVASNKERALEGVAQASDRETELEKICNDQSAKIEELNKMVEQLKGNQEKVNALGNGQEIEKSNVLNPEPEIIKETYAIGENNQGNVTFDLREKEELLMEIQYLRKKLQAYADSLPNKSLDKLRSSLLSRSMNLRKSMSSQFNSAEELEQERQRWTEMESEWINLTDELRVDIVSQRQYAEKVEMELQQERKNLEETDDALHRAVLGHARFVEHYVDLQEKYNHLSESHRRIMETITDVKRAAAKAGAKGSGARYAKAFAAELTAGRAEEKRERERLRKENKGLRLQLRETAEAVQTAGELLVRLREAEEASSHAESSLTGLQQENEKLRKQMEKMKNKHKMDMVTMKQYMAESKLPESALRPLHFEEPLPTSTFSGPDDDESWRSAFGPAYEHNY